MSGNSVQGSSGTLLKEQGFFNLVQNMGHKGPALRPRCIGPGRARTQIPSNSSPIQFTSRLFYLQNIILGTVDFRVLGMEARHGGPGS